VNHDVHADKKQERIEEEAAFANQGSEKNGRNPIRAK
jgi:hypothetical protein